MKEIYELNGFLYCCRDPNRDGTFAESLEQRLNGIVVFEKPVLRTYKDKAGKMEKVNCYYGKIINIDEGESKIRFRLMHVKNKRIRASFSYCDGIKAENLNVIRSILKGIGLQIKE